MEMRLCKGVYLAGPMAGLRPTVMKGWREIAKLDLEAAQIPVLDPTRRITYHEQTINDKGLNHNAANRIFKQDLRDIARCEVLLVDMRDHHNAKSQGTAAEMMFAHMKNKIIIVWKDKNDSLNPFITAMATEVYNTLSDAIDAAIDYAS